MKSELTNSHHTSQDISCFHVNVGFFTKSLYRVFSGQEPPGPVVSVLTAWLEMEVVKAPILELLAEILDADLTPGNKYNPLIGPITREEDVCNLDVSFLNLPALVHSPPGRGGVCWSGKVLGSRQSCEEICQNSIPGASASRRHTAPLGLQRYHQLVKSLHEFKS